MTIKSRLQDDVKLALKSKDRQRLGVLRLVLAAIKQREVDERVELDEQAVLAVLDKMAKQRRDSMEQFEKAGRSDLLAQEQFELDLIKEYLPEPLSDQALQDLIEAAVSSTGADSIRDMGAVMGQLRPQVQGRVDMKQVSEAVRNRLGA